MTDANHVAIDSAQQHGKRYLDARASRHGVLKGAAGGALASLGLRSAASQTPEATPSAGGTTPNILVLMGDDIDYWNISAYNLGMMAT